MNLEQETTPETVPTTASEPELQPMDERKHGRRRSKYENKISYGLMFGLLLVGLLAAVCHHLFYSYLNNRELKDVLLPQPWVIRMGNAIAFLFKLALVSAIGMAYAQAFWFFVRRKDIKIGSLDAMFGVLSNPALFLNVDLFLKTTVLCSLAAISWILPISAVLSPGSLTGSSLCRKSNLS